MARATAPPPKARLKQPLVVKGQQLATGELIKRLKALHDELTPMEQEEVEEQSLESTAAELVQKTLLVHKDKSVKAYTACCLADMLKLYAPEPPYSDRELSDIFSFFFVQLRNLAKPDDPQIHQYHYLLRNMAEVRSIALVCRLPDAEKLMNRVFEDSFDSLTANTSRGIVSMLVDILSQLVDEMDSVPMDVIERILAQFLPKNAKSRPYTLTVAKEICERSTDKLQRYVSQYFTEVFDTLDGLKTGADAEDEEEEAQDDLLRIKAAHGLIKEINRNCAGLLLNVIPQLQSELTMDNDAVRILATKTVGSMLAGHNDMATIYPQLWSHWLGRSTDKSSAVRIACLEALRNVWATHPLHSADIQTTIAARFEDPDDKVRLAACAVFTELDFEIALHHLDAHFLESLSMRIKDKKIAVAAEAVKSLARFFSLAYPSIERVEGNIVERFGMIPRKLFDALYIREQELLSVIQKAIIEDIAPLPSSADEEVAWVDRLMLIYSLLDETRERKALLRQTNISLKINTWASFIDACEKYNGGVIDQDEEKVTAQLKALARSVAANMPDPSKTGDNLLKFAKLNEKRFYKLLRVMMNPHSDLRTILKAHHEFERKIKDHATIADTMHIFVRRSGLLMLCQSSLPALLRRVQSPDEGANGQRALNVAVQLLTHVAEGKAVMFANHVDMLVEGLSDSTNEPYVDMCLFALSMLAKADPSAIDGSVSNGERTLQEYATHYVKNGSVYQAKAAATIMALDTSSMLATGLLISELADELAAVDSARLAIHLSALSRFARYAPASFETYGETITSFVLEQVLTQPVTDETAMDPEADWAEDDELSHHALASLAGLKLLSNRLRALKDEDEAKIISQPVYALLWQLLDSGGDVQGVRQTPAVAARLRSLAAVSLLRLAAIKVHELEVLRKFEALAWTIQDPVFQVRNKFLEKVTEYLFRQRLLNPAFNVILFLVAHDPEEENRNMAKSNIMNRAKAVDQDRRIRLFEQPFLRMLHLLSHHPDFSTARGSIVETAKYINFYLDCVAVAENISYLNFLANILKSVRDKQVPSSDNLYAISELADYLIKAWATEKRWPISNYTGKVVLPQDLFAGLSSSDAAKAIRTTHYLQRETLEALERDAKDAKSRPKKPKIAKAKKVKDDRSEAGDLEGDAAEEDAKPPPKPKQKRKSDEKPPSKAKKPPAAKKAPVKKRKKEWDSDASSAQDEEDLDLGDTSEEEVKPKGSRSRPKPKTPKRKTQPTNDPDDDEVDALLVHSPAKKSSPSRRTSSPAKVNGKTPPKKRKATKRAKANDTDDVDENDDDAMNEA